MKGRLEVPRIGSKPDFVEYQVGVREEKVEHHTQVRQRLQDVMRTWSVDDVDEAITACAGPDFPERFEEKKCKCTGCRLPKHVISVCLLLLERLKGKRQDCSAAYKRGTVSVDERLKSVSILQPIDFASRKPPDASAELEESKAAGAITVIKDVAIVLKAYLEKMIVEGHTGATSPPDYWNQLALNRADLICSILVENGVSTRLLKGVGTAGGGAKVDIYPASNVAKQKTSKE